MVDTHHDQTHPAHIEVPSLRAALREILGRTDFPQIVLRMGYGQEVAPTPRRSVSEVLLY